MNLNNAGLPPSGRELDADVWEMLGYVVFRSRADFFSIKSPHPPYHPPYAVWHDSFYPWYWDKVRNKVLMVPRVSTTHAYFQVMEAANTDRQRMILRDHGDRISVWLLRETYYCTFGNVCVQPADYPSREAAYAHVVCCCVWKARQDE